MAALEGAKGVWEGAVDGLFDLLIYFCMDFADTSNEHVQPHLPTSSNVVRAELRTLAP